MRARWNKEKVFFLLSAALFAWAMLKLGLFLTDRPVTPGGPAAARVAIQPGDPDLRRHLPAPSLAHRLPGRDPFAPPHEPPPERKPPLARDPKAGGAAQAKVDEQLKGGPRREQQGDRKPQGGEHGGRAKGGEKPKPDERPAVPPPPPEELSQLRLIAVVRIEGPPPECQAILRHQASGKLYRAAIGDVLLDGLRLDDITDDCVVLTDTRGARFTCRGRFDAQYGN